MCECMDGWTVQFRPTREHAVQIERLRQPEPILFYDEVILYEDELADNGLAQLTAKVRVMPR